MNINKLIQIVYFVLKKYDFRLNYMKLTKLIYLADRKAIEEIGEDITGMTAYSMDYGPVLSELLDLIKGNFNPEVQSIWNQAFAKSGHDLVCIKTDIDDGELCEYEEDIISNLDFLYHSKTPWEMVNLVHNSKVCPEWKDPNGSRILINRKELMLIMGYTEDECDYLLENSKIYKEEFSKLKREVV